MPLVDLCKGEQTGYKVHYALFTAPVPSDDKADGDLRLDLETVVNPWIYPTRKQDYAPNNNLLAK
jgi:hypothetical protein